MTTKLASLTELWQEFDLPGTQVSSVHNTPYTTKWKLHSQKVTNMPECE